MYVVNAMNDSIRPCKVLCTVHSTEVSTEKKNIKIKMGKKNVEDNLTIVSKQ